jgi:hypothetical protein
MPNAPEVEHLRRAVEAIKNGLLPEKQKQADKQDLSQHEADEPEEEDEKK